MVFALASAMSVEGTCVTSQLRHLRAERVSPCAVPRCSVAGRQVNAEVPSDQSLWKAEPHLEDSCPEGLARPSAD